MTPEERKAVREYATRMALDLRAAERSVEMLANALEHLRQRVLIHHREFDGYNWRIFDLLHHTRNLERVPMYAPAASVTGTSVLPEWKQRGPESEFRWVTIETFDRFRVYFPGDEARRYELLMAEMAKAEEEEPCSGIGGAR